MPFSGAVTPASARCILDTAKAFDSVDHTTLLVVAEAAGLPSDMIIYLQDYY